MLKRRSKRHEQIYNAIKDISIDIKIVEEYSIDSNLFIDMYLPDFSLGIEIDGQQHMEENAFFHRTETAFAEQKLRDARKNLRCKEEGIFLYRLPFNDKRDEAIIVKDIFHKSAVYFDKIVQDSQYLGNETCVRCDQYNAYKGELCLFCIREEKQIERIKNSKWRRRLRSNKNRK